MSFFYGPINKSIFTQELELFGKCLLANPKDIYFGYKTSAVNQDPIKKQLYAYVGEDKIEVNISKLLEKADFTHINLSSSDSQAYLNLNLNFNHYNYNSGHHSEPQFSQAEKKAIQYYTGSGYLSINNLMYTKGEKYEINNIKHSDIAKDLLDTMFLSSALNKIMPTQSSNMLHSYRGEHSTSQAEIQERIKQAKAIANSDDSDAFTKTPAYMSTSSSKHVADDFASSFSQSKVLIEFDGLYGKSIEGISLVSGEKEYLLPPGKIQWTGYQKKETEFGSCHEFKAKVVNPLILDENNANVKDILEFKNLYEWYENHSQESDLSFITEHNQQQYLALAPKALILPVQEEAAHYLS